MRKGQYTLLEQVILFALGISITLGFLFAFKDLRSTVGEDVTGVQAAVVSEYLASASVELVESEAEGTMEVPVPENIAADTYVIRMGDGGIKIQLSGHQEISSLYGLGARLEEEGAVESGAGRAAITHTDDDLTIGRGD